MTQENSTSPRYAQLKERRVDLEVTAIGVHGQSGIEDERIWKLEIARCNAPDGEYVLHYFLSKNRSGYVRVEKGVCWHSRTG